MTATLGSHLRALLTDLGVPHPGSPGSPPRERFLPDATIRSSRDPVPVMVEAPGVSRDALSAVGLHAQYEGSGSIVAGMIRADLVPGLAEVPGVLSIGLEDPGREDIHSSVPATRATAVREGTLGLTGAGVIVGVVDSGIDIFHHAFRKADGKTRIISLLDTTSPHRLKGEGGPTGGTFQIGWVPPGGAQQLTPVLNHSATAAQVLAALQSLGAIEPGDVAVTGGPLPGAPITIHFQGQYLHRTISPPTIRNPTITPATAAIVFERGQVYTEQQINDALDAPPSVFMSWDSGGHGTHVMGIAAGDGSQAGNCHLEDYYVGVAPEADLVAVKTNWTDVQTMRGIQHVFTTADIRATQVGHDVAAVVNLSLTGEHSGARDGSTQLEKDIDIALVGDPPGRVIVKSAGNYGRLHDYAAQRQVYWTGSASHAFTAVPASGSATLSAIVLSGDKRDDVFDFWYRGAGRIDLEIRVPGPEPATRGSVTAGTSTTLTLSGHTVLVQSTVDSPDPGTHHVFVRISPRSSGTIKPGTWEFTLTETAGAVTDVHCWIEVEKTDRHPRFTAADQDRSSTLTPPGTARRIISVANYDHADSTLAESSSRGPTTDSRTGYDTKPDVAAPGTGIVAAKAGGSNSGICCDCCSNDFYTAKTGTSMAAPHVTGIIALMLERNRDLTWEQIRAHLRDSADPPDPITGPTLPNHEWGAGVVNAEVAVASVPAFVADGDPVHLSATIDDGAPHRGRGATAADGTTDRPTTDRPTTASPRRPSPVPVAQLRAAALRSATGQLVFSLVSTHLSEGIRLVNTDRRTMVAWHRMGGPELLRSVLDTPHDSAPVIPTHVAGRELRTGLSTFLDELARAGSLPLRTDVERHRALLEALPGSSLDALDDLHVAG